MCSAVRSAALPFAHTIPHLSPDVFCTSVVDHSRLQVDELTYLLSEHSGDSDVEAYIDKLVSVWLKIRAISAALGPLGQGEQKFLAAPQNRLLLQAPPAAVPAPAHPTSVQDLTPAVAGLAVA
jgi:hypothetical protein